MSKTPNTAKTEDIEKNRSNPELPKVCQLSYLQSKTPSYIVTETKDWLKKTKSANAIWINPKDNESINMNNPKEEKFFKPIISSCLFALYNQRDKYTLVAVNMDHLDRFPWLCNILVFCEMLRYDLDKWSSSLLDGILDKGLPIFARLCQDLKIKSNQDFHLSELNTCIKWKEKNYFITIQKISKGFLYSSHNLKVMNLAQALSLFFRHHQFGILECQERHVALGYAVDVEHGYFLYDCQNKREHLMGSFENNSYLLKTKYLQILLYCIVVTLNIQTEKIPFHLYNVDIKIEDPQEKEMTQKLLAKLSKKEDNKISIIEESAKNLRQFRERDTKQNFWGQGPKRKIKNILANAKMKWKKQPMFVHNEKALSGNDFFQTQTSNTPNDFSEENQNSLKNKKFSNKRIPKDVKCLKINNKIASGQPCPKVNENPSNSSKYSAVKTAIWSN